MDSRAAYLPNPLEAVELSLTRFVERLPWLGGDLQTLRNFIHPRSIDLSGFSIERVVLPLDDKGGDRAIGTLHRPVEPRPGRPLAILLHGLNGCENSQYMRVTSAHLLRAGFPVLRLNLRGAGASRPFCRARYHAGRSDDLRCAFAALPPHLTVNGVVAVGFSLGGNLLLKYLGEVERATPLLAAATVSAPIDLMATAHRIMAPRNALYHWYFLHYCQSDVAAAGDGVAEEERRASAAARSLWEFDERVTAPRNGFAGAADYYTRASARKFLDGIAVPTLLVQAEDDPIVPAEPYRRHSWQRNRRLLPAVERKGGHVGFHDRRGGTWHDGTIQAFFERVLSLS